MSSLMNSYGFIKASDVPATSTNEAVALDYPVLRVRCLSDDGEMLRVISANSHSSSPIEACIKRDGYILEGYPAYSPGDKVRILKTGRVATVEQPIWHEKRQCYYYKLSYNDRLSTNWFFNEDIEPYDHP